MDNQNTDLISLVCKLHDTGALAPHEYRLLLLSDHTEAVSALHEEAAAVSRKYFGNRIYVRGLLEISNICRNDCLYCGIRKSNLNIRRYSLTDAEIIACCDKAYQAGFRTFVLQGGEQPESASEHIERLCRTIHGRFPDCAITLSLGEYSDDAYRRFRAAGADRYLLRHETYNPRHYARLHPAEMSRAHRLHCLDVLKGLGFQTGTGIMAGSPFQTADDIVEDILYIGKLKPQMIGIGPFIPHADTVFAGWWEDGPGIIPGMSRKETAMEITLRLISVFRLMFPKALIPATTALSTISSSGREAGILAGANVVMPNITPHHVRQDYSLYDGKVSDGAESAEGMDSLCSLLGNIGYCITWDKGDYGSCIV